MTRTDLPIGLVRWTCGWHCGLSLLVSGDMGDDRGWAAVREHRAGIKKEKA